MSEQRKVLMAENNMPLAMFMVSVLTLAGFDVKPVFTGEMALIVATERKFDVIILEAALPDVNGYEICRDLKQRHISWKTPVVLISADTSIENQQYALALGAADIIVAPFEADEFKTRILYCLNPGTIAGTAREKVAI